MVEVKPLDGAEQRLDVLAAHCCCTLGRKALLSFRQRVGPHKKTLGRDGMQFDFQELAEALECSFTRRVALRPIALSDAWPLFAATRNPAFNRHLAWAQPENEELVLKRVRLIMDASRKGRLTALSAVQRSTGEFIGLFRFLPHATLQDTVEMGVWMHDKFWHGRYSLELTKLCISAAFSLSGVSRLLGATTLG